MTVTHNDEHLAGLHRAADTFRRALTDEGFIDDGYNLYGTVEWRNQGNTHQAKISVNITPRFPFSPPKVKIIESDATPTFHIEREDGALCLWTSDTTVDNAPWQDTKQFIKKVSGWFANTEKGWPGDNDADLERYLISDDEHIILYDSETIIDGKYYRTSSPKEEVIRVAEELKWLPNFSRQKDRGVRRRERNLCYVLNVGSVEHPIQSWQDIILLVGHDCSSLRKLIEIGSLSYLLIKYMRGTRSAVLMVGFTKLGELKAYETADESAATRTLRSGKKSATYSKKRVIIVGCGAIGSHIADLLYKSGVRKITLVDPERLRPGNLIRHLCDDKYVGLYKVLATKKQLESLGLDVSGINISAKRINDPEDSVELLKNYDLIIDTTADTRATAQLHWASEQLEMRMISVCLQRDGGIARVDRFPVWDDEEQLEAIPDIPGSVPAFEKGCGSPVSITPPLSVIKAAALGTQIALDELDMAQHHPATVIEVIVPQPDKPYDELSVITSMQKRM